MAHLEYQIGGRRLEFELAAPDVSIGRADTCTLQLLHDAKLSRVHCTLQRQVDGSYALLDAHSRNGTFLNGRRLVNEEATLHDLDQITVGDTVLVFRSEAPGKTTVIFGEVAREFDKGKGFHTILNEIVDKKK